MQFDLSPHPATPPAEPFDLWVNAEYSGDFGEMATLNLWFGLRAPIERFVIPRSDAPGRRDELWTTTCFEAFLQPQGEPDYAELNFSPSGDWGAYDFDSYRDGMAQLELSAPPYIRVEDNLTWWALGATVAIPSGRQWNAGFSAVIEEVGGAKSYWALAHTAAKPDFHDPACFTARLG